MELQSDVHSLGEPRDRGMDLAGTSTETYNSMVNMLKYPDQDSLKRLSTILMTLDIESRKAILTHGKEGENLMCHATDIRSLVVLLEVIPEQDRLGVLLRKSTENDENSIHILRLSKELQYNHCNENFIHVIKVLMTMLDSNDRTALLRQQRNQDNGSILGMVLFTLARHVTSYNSHVQELKFYPVTVTVTADGLLQERDRVIKATQFILHSISSDELVKLLNQGAPLKYLLNKDDGYTNGNYRTMMMRGLDHIAHPLFIVLKLIPTEHLPHLLSLCRLDPYQLERGETLFMRYIACVSYKQEYHFQSNDISFVEGGFFVPLVNSSLHFIIDNISHDDRVRLMEQEDIYGATALHRVKSVAVLRLLCKGLSSEIITILLSMLDMNLHETPLERILQNSREFYNSNRSLMLDFECDNFGAVLKSITINDLQYLLSLNDSALVKLASQNKDMMRCLMERLPQEIRLDFLVSHNVGRLGLSAHSVIEYLPPTERVGFLNITDESNCNPLHHEQWYDMKRCLDMIPPEYWLSLVMMQNIDGDTPLHKCWKDKQLASHYCRIDEDFTDILKTGETLSDKIKPLLIRNNDGETILHMSTHSSILKLFDMLNITKPFLEAFALLSIQNSLGNTVLNRIESGHYSMCVVQLLKYVDESKRFEIMRKANNSKETLLHKLDYQHPKIIMAIYDVLGHSIMKDLLAIKDKNGDTPMHKVCLVYATFYSVIIGIPFIDRIGLVMLQNNNGFSPLHVVAEAKSAMMVKCIVEMVSSTVGVEPQSTTTAGPSNDVTSIKPDMVKLVELKDKRGYTALHISIALNDFVSTSHMVRALPSTEVCNILSISVGENDLRIFPGDDNWTLTKLCLVKFEGLPERHLIFKLVGSVPKTSQSLASAAAELNKEDFRELEEKILRLNIEELKKDYLWLEGLRFHDGNSILHHLAENKDSKSLKKVLQALSVDQRLTLMSKRNINGKTALDIARSYEVKHLLEWSHNQKGFYYLSTSPAVIIMYSTVDREGAEEESKQLMDVFPEFNARITKKKNTRKQEMLDAIRLAQQREDISALVVIIMSHGVQGSVCASDGDLSIQEILLQMCSPDLEGKPKVLLVQACQNRDVSRPSRVRAGIDPRPPRPKTPETATEVPPNDRIPRDDKISLQHRDVILMMATVSGNVAYRNLMIPMFAEELRDSKDGDIYDIFLTTHDKMRVRLKDTPGQDQIPEFRSTLTQKLCLRNIFKEP